jgi:hypothetical protein
MGQLELVGVAEAAEILAVPASRVKRWQTEGRSGTRMPLTVAEPRTGSVWVREDVEALRDGATEFPEREQLPLIGVSDAAGVLGVDKSQIGRWRRRKEFPLPAYELRAGPLWMRDDVVAFGARRSAA